MDVAACSAPTCPMQHYSNFLSMLLNIVEAKKTRGFIFLKEGFSKAFGSWVVAQPLFAKCVVIVTSHTFVGC